MNIKKLAKDESVPMNLLLLADPSKEVINDYIKRGQCFVAEMDNKKIGVYVLLPTRPETVELVNIAVDEKYHNKGNGKRMLQHAINQAKSLGYKIMEVGTGNSSIHQLAFYQKAGFRITGVDRDYFSRFYTEEIFENGIQCRDMVRLSVEL